ncbi:hypothetical protein SUGI_0706480 [Cryptomeria japonica]|nr:hypothetical protein SUGI_0706480 [Cryptomeria japonica]
MAAIVKPLLPLLLLVGMLGLLTVAASTLTKGKPYKYNLKVLPRGYIFECTCNLFNKTEPILQTEYIFVDGA